MTLYSFNISCTQFFLYSTFIQEISPKQQACLELLYLLLSLLTNSNNFVSFLMPCFCQSQATFPLIHCSFSNTYPLTFSFQCLCTLGPTHFNTAIALSRFFWQQLMNHARPPPHKRCVKSC